MNLKKYKYAGLAIELTRKCNRKCSHCSNGEPQDLTITEEIIDRIIDEAADCYRVFITGGESTLCLDKLSYLVNRIIDSDWTTEEFQLTTNGSVVCEELIALLDKFCQSRENRYARLRISTDEFHDKTESDIAIQRYQRYAMRNSNIVIEPVQDIRTLFLSGRAKDMADANDDILKNYFLSYEASCSHRIRIKKDVVSCLLLINANGNVCVHEQASFETLDRLSFGNILHSPLSEAIEKHNNDCLTTCTDCEYLQCLGAMSEYYGKGTPPLDGFTTKTNSTPANASFAALGKISEKITERTISLRYLARSVFPYICAADIISAIPTREDIGMYAMKSFIARNPQIDTISDEDIRNYLEPVFQEHYFEAARQYKSDGDNFLFALRVSNYKALAALRKYDGDLEPRELFGNDADKMNCEVFQHLRELNQLYSDGKREPNNQICIPCAEDSSENVLKQVEKAKLQSEREQSEIRCLNCGKVMIYKGRPIHCKVEKNGTLIRCDYCGAAHDVLNRKKKG